MDKKKLLLLIMFFLNISAGAFASSNEYNSIVKEIKSGNLDFAFLKLDTFLREYPDSPYKPKVQFGIAEYYFQIKDYSDSITELVSLIKNYPEDKNVIFAYALLYKINLEYQEEPELSDKIKEKFFSRPVFLLFSDSKVKSYVSILNNKYNITEYIDRIEFFKNDELLFEVTP